MDPNLFHLDWDRLAEVLAAIVVLSMILERTLAIVFEHRWFVAKYHKKGLKEIIAFGVAAGVCFYWDFDAVSMIILTEKTTTFGSFLTAGIIAGGSKGSVKLFRDVMGFKSNAVKEKQEEEEKKKKDSEKEPEAPAPEEPQGRGRGGKRGGN